MDDRQSHAGSIGDGRRARSAEHCQPVRAVLHDEGGGLRHRPRAEPPDCRSTRRDTVAREPDRSTRDAGDAAAALVNDVEAGLQTGPADLKVSLYAAGTYRPPFRRPDAACQLSRGTIRPVPAAPPADVPGLRWGVVTDVVQPDAAGIQRAAGVLRAGGLVAFPTET